LKNKYARTAHPNKKKGKKNVTRAVASEILSSNQGDITRQNTLQKGPWHHLMNEGKKSQAERSFSNLIAGVFHHYQRACVRRVRRVKEGANRRTKSNQINPNYVARQKKEGSGKRKETLIEGSVPLAQRRKKNLFISSKKEETTREAKHHQGKKTLTSGEGKERKLKL